MYILDVLTGSTAPLADSNRVIPRESRVPGGS